MRWTRPTWLRNLCLAHYLVHPSWLKQRVPHPLRLETRQLPDGQTAAYVSIVLLEDALVGLPSPCPRLVPYVQLNVRTYVTHETKRGVYFFASFISNALMAHLVSGWLGVPFTYARLRRERLPASAAGQSPQLEYRGSHPALWDGSPTTARWAFRLSGTPVSTAPHTVPGFASAAEATDVLGHPQWGFYAHAGQVYSYSVHHPAFGPGTLLDAQAEGRMLEKLPVVSYPYLPSDEGESQPRQRQQQSAGPAKLSPPTGEDTTSRVGSTLPVSIFYVPELYFSVQLPPQPLLS